MKYSVIPQAQFQGVFFFKIVCLEAIVSRTSDISFGKLGFTVRK